MLLCIIMKCNQSIYYVLTQQVEVFQPGELAHNMNDCYKAVEMPGFLFVIEVVF